MKALHLGDEEGLRPALELGEGVVVGGLERLPEMELCVVHQAHAGGHHTRGLQVVEERQSCFEVGEQNAAIHLLSRQREELHDGRRDDPEVSLATEHDVLGVGAHALARRDLGAADDALGGHDLHIEDDVLDVAVAVALHARGVRSDPTPQRGELEAVGLVAHGELCFRELGGDVTPHGARFDASHAVHGIDPEDLVHAAHVEGHDGSGLRRIAAQRVGDVRATPEGDDAGAVRFDDVDELHHFVVARGKHHEVGNARQGLVSDLPDLGAGMPMATAKARRVVGADLVVLQERAQRRGQGGIGFGSGHSRRIL